MLASGSGFAIVYDCGTEERHFPCLTLIFFLSFFFFCLCSSGAIGDLQGLGLEVAWCSLQ